jgi:hypothetical protein
MGIWTYLSFTPRTVIRQFLMLGGPQGLFLPRIPFGILMRRCWHGREYRHLRQQSFWGLPVIRAAESPQCSRLRQPRKETERLSERWQNPAACCVQPTLVRRSSGRSIQGDPQRSPGRVGKRLSAPELGVRWGRTLTAFTKSSNTLVFLQSQYRSSERTIGPYSLLGSVLILPEMQSQRSVSFLCCLRLPV